MSEALDLEAIKAREQAATRPIPGFPGYEVDSGGTVYSATNWRGYGFRPMRPSTNEDGYLYVRLTVERGRRRKVLVHHAVLAAFGAVRPSETHEVRHLNGDRIDNRLVNLQWGTQAENAADRDLHGTTARGSRNGFAKLSEHSVMKIREDLDSGASKRQVADRYGVSQRTIGAIARGERWQHV